jgi:hypothetical protein
MLLFALDGSLLPFTANTPAFVPLLKLPPEFHATAQRRNVVVHWREPSGLMRLSLRKAFALTSSSRRS